MTDGTPEDLLTKTLRWMEENLDGAYHAVYPAGHDKAGKPCTNSGTALITFAYMGILGKVLCKGGPPNSTRRDFDRFTAFLHQCMPDFKEESDRHAFLFTPKARTGGEEWLYEVYRNGFAHTYYPDFHGWSRYPGRTEYWIQVQP